MNRPLWTIYDPRFTPEALGFLPEFLSLDDHRPAAEQFDTNYPFGGWSPFTGFIIQNPTTLTLRYPGDPPLAPIAGTSLRSERIRLYRHSWVAIFQPDDSFQIARLD